MATTRAHKKEIVDYLLKEIDYDTTEIAAVVNNYKYDSVEKLLFLIEDEEALEDLQTSASLPNVQISMRKKLVL
jgi:hypothetical protein